MKRSEHAKTAEVTGRSNTVRKRSSRNWRQTIEPKFWAPREDSEEEKQFESGPNGTNDTGNALPELQSEPPAHRPITEHPSQAEEDFQAAMFTLSELLETPRYLKLHLTKERLESLAREASASPLPEGAKRVETVKTRLRRSLDTEKQAKAMSGMPGKPIRGRFRRTLRYDHKKRPSPSRIFDNAILFSQMSYDKARYDSPEDYASARSRTIGRKLGSESDDSQNTEMEQRLEVLRKLVPGPSELLSQKQCDNCGAPLEREETCYTVIRLRRSPEGNFSSIEPVAFSCDQCGISPQRREEWMQDLTEEELAVYELGKTLTQAKIASAVGKSQGQISRILKRIDNKLSTARRERILQMGGA